jgi:uncharacterized membrane protein YhfC
MFSFAERLDVFNLFDATSSGNAGGAVVAYSNGYAGLAAVNIAVAVATGLLAFRKAANTTTKQVESLDHKLMEEFNCLFQVIEKMRPTSGDHPKPAEPKPIS